MQKKNTAAIVVPIYKVQPHEKEIISLLQGIKVLRAYPFIFVCPLSLDVSVYQELSAAHTDVRFIRFEDRYFKDISGYNDLMLSLDFYQSFTDFRYILIYQLDAFVFKDELEYWCSQNYDYIGAPWMGEGWEDWIDNWDHIKTFPWWSRNRKRWQFLTGRHKRVGNGGFSLRKVSSHISTLQKMKGILKNWTLFEDVFWSMMVGSYRPFFRIPSVEKAARFSIETNPEKAFREYNHSTLPFGCHAWYVHGTEFWKPIIESYGYKYEI